MTEANKIEIENVMSPGRTKRVDRAKYDAMRTALLSVLPTEAPGMTEADAKAKLLPLLSDDLFPGGEKVGWWLGAVRLDLEAKGIVMRANTKPKRYHQTAKPVE